MRDVRVLELAGSVSAAYCARLFAATGADVVLVEPPDGAPLRRRGPRSPTADGTARAARCTSTSTPASARSSLDLAGDDGDAALALGRRRRRRPRRRAGRGDARCASGIRAAQPGTRALVPSAASGSTGPYADVALEPDLVDWAAGGYLFLTGEPGRAPLQGGGPWAIVLAGADRRGRRAPSPCSTPRAPARASSSTSARWRRIAAGHQWALTHVHPHRRA